MIHFSVDRRERFIRQFTLIWKDLYEVCKDTENRDGLNKLFLDKYYFVVHYESLFWLLHFLFEPIIEVGFDSFNGVLEFKAECDTPKLEYTQANFDAALSMKERMVNNE